MHKAAVVLLDRQDHRGLQAHQDRKVPRVRLVLLVLKAHKELTHLLVLRFYVT